MGAPSLQQAFARHQAGDLAAAVDLYRRVIAAQPNHAEARHLFGIALMQGGDLAAAREELERAVALDGGQAAWWNNLGLARFYGDDFAGARAGYAKALALGFDPSKPLDKVFVAGAVAGVVQCSALDGSGQLRVRCNGGWGSGARRCSELL